MAIVATGQLTIYDSNDGTSVYTAFIYRKYDTTPTAPTGGSYNFGTNSLTAPTDWLSTIPETTEISTWVSAYTFMGLGEQTVTAGEWSEPKLYAMKGVDNIAVRLSNESHIIPCDSGGIPTDYAGSGTNIYVYEGAERSNYAPLSNSTSLSAKTWYIRNTTTTSVGVRLKSGTNITSGTITDVNDYASVGNASGMSAETASLKFEISGKNSRGVSYTLYIDQTFVKAKSGSLAATFRITNSGVTLVKGVDDVISPKSVKLNTACTSLTSISYRWYKNELLTSIETAFYDVPLADYSDVLANTYKCTVSGTLGGSLVSLSDEITIPLLSTDKPVPSVLLTDQSKMFTAPATGYAIPSFTGGDCGFKAYLGSDPLVVRKSLSCIVKTAREFTAEQNVPEGSGWAVFTSVAPPTLSVGVPYAITKKTQSTFTVDDYAASVTANSAFRVMLATKGTRASFGLSSKTGVTVGEVEEEVPGYSVCTLPSPTAMSSDNAEAVVLCLIVGYDNKPYVIERKVTYSLSRAGTQGESGSTVSISPDREPIFTSTDGVVDADQADIVYTATVVGGTSSTGYSWVMGTKTGAGTTFTVTQTDISASVKVACTVTLNGKEYKDTDTILLLNDSSSEPGATVGVSFMPRYIVPTLTELGALTKIGAGVYSLDSGTFTKAKTTAIMKFVSSTAISSSGAAIQFTVGELQSTYSIGFVNESVTTALNLGFVLEAGVLNYKANNVTKLIGRYIKGDVLTVVYSDNKCYLLKNNIALVDPFNYTLDANVRLYLYVEQSAAIIRSIGFAVTYADNFRVDSEKVGNVVGGKINSENVGKVFADNTFSSAQIGTLIMDKDFQFGVDPTNPVSGMTITPEYLAIYVGNVLRVKLGKLS